MAARLSCLSLSLLNATGSITSQLAEDAALLHSFSGEPIRTMVLNLSSVLVGVVISFVYMWPFALLSLATIPFLGFGAEMEMVRSPKAVLFPRHEEP